MGFVNTPELMARLEDTPRLSDLDLDLDEYDAIMIAGGLAPMFTYRDRQDVQAAIRHFYESLERTPDVSHYQPDPRRSSHACRHGLDHAQEGFDPRF